jgi:outer membrane protein TolC
MNEVAVARINTLMNLPTTMALPPAPKTLKPDGQVPSLEELQRTAVANRPDLQALANRIAADQAQLALTYKEFKPDFELMAGYDAFWQERALRTMVGVRMNAPVRRATRRGAVAEASAELARRSAELAKVTNQVNLQVQEAYSQVLESEKLVRLYAEVTLPAAEANVKAAQAAYITGKIPFLSLIEAERNLISLRDRSNEALADLFRRRATLERSVGGTLPAVVPDALPPK